MPRITDFRAQRRLFGAVVLAAVSLAAGAVTFAANTPRVDNPHGKFRDACALCHGAGGWTPAKVSARFDHGARYGFPLTGAHSTSNCMTCHTTLEFAQTRTQCASCHEDPHQGELGTDCAHCHNARSFVDRGPMVKAHNLSRFPLTGGHATVDCESCHEGAAQGHMQFVGTPSDCKSCHMEQYRSTKNPDHAAGGYPTECQTCHRTGRWQTATFDHDRTAFTLTGVHRQSACASCHSGGRYKGLASACASCHQSRYDSATPNHVNAGFPASQCATCHDTKSWSDAIFDHNATAFPLTGAHKGPACNACHADGVYRGKSTACSDCHMAQYNSATPAHTPGGFPLAACASCHDTQSWSDAVFNHNATPFPLQGAHATATCNDCHSDGHYADKPINCLSCHATAFAAATPRHDTTDFPDAQCGTCHGRTVWSGGVYNHAATRFPLTGAHTATTCVSCHGDGVYSTKSTACSDCHLTQYNAATPAHTPASFPLAACASCHTTTNWSTSTFNHNTTAFPLTGRHTTTACASCHGDGVYAGKSTDCYACHKPTYDTAVPTHDTTFFPTAQCGTCHGTTAWTGGRIDHDGPWFPIYSGRHAGTWSQCQTCHTNMSSYAVFTCLSCHPHSDKPTTDQHHSQVRNYSYDSNACYSCHPRGTTN